MLVLKNWLHPVGIGPSGEPGVTAVSFTAQGLTEIGMDYKKPSYVYLDSSARDELGFPSLVEYISSGKVARLTLTAHEIDATESRDWVDSTASVWRKDKGTKHVFLFGLGSHTEVEYDMQTVYDPPEAIFLPSEQAIGKSKIRTVAEHRGVYIALFTSEFPSGYRGPPMGGYDEAEPAWPQFKLYLGVTKEEYEVLLSYLEKPIAFSVQLEPEPK